jgi:hypothetical protein
MEPKTYIILLMFIILIIIAYNANIFGQKKEIFDAHNKIIKPDNTNIDNLDVKQLKKLVSEQNMLINKQTELINNYVDKIEKNRTKYIQNIIKPQEDIENYFNKVRELNDEVIRNNQTEIDDDNILDRYKNNINIIKTYLEDPIMRGANIYESEQYSKLLQIGNIVIDEPNTPPHPMKWSININKQ